MPEQPPAFLQTDFIAELEKPVNVVKEKPNIGKELKKRLAKKNIKTIRMGDNIPAGGRLGGYQSHIDGNQNAPDFNTKR